MNRLRHYATYGNTRDFRPEEEEKPLGEVIVVHQAWSEAEIGKCIDSGFVLHHSVHLFPFLFIESIKHDSANCLGRFRSLGITEIPPVTIRQTFMPSLKIHFCLCDCHVDVPSPGVRRLTLNERFTNTIFLSFIKTAGKEVKHRSIISV